MAKEVSDKAVIVLLVLTFLFVVGGTLIVYDSVNNYKEDRVQIGVDGSATGMVTLEVVEDYPEEVENEDLK